MVLGDHRLADAQIEALLGALQRSKLDAPHPLVPALRAHADAASLDRFAWALFEHWLVAGAPSKENWALFGLGLLGGDATALKLAALVSGSGRARASTSGRLPALSACAPSAATPR